MIAVDTNILVYAHRADTSMHRDADLRLTELAESPRAWAIPWPCLHEFLAIVTHPKIFRPPTPLKVALEQIEHWLDSPTLTLLSEEDGYWPILNRIIESGHISGPGIHDARIAALCLFHGVDTLWSADRDFTRVKDLHAVNPLLKQNK